MKIAGVIMRIEILQDGRKVLVLGNEDDPMRPLLDSLHRTNTGKDEPAKPRADLRRFIQQQNDWHGRTGRRARGRKH